MHPSRTNDLAYPRRPVMDGPLCEAGRSGSLAVSVDGCQRQLEKPYVRARGTPEQKNTAAEEGEGGRRCSRKIKTRLHHRQPNLSIHLSSRLRLFPQARTHTTGPRPQTQKPDPGARADQPASTGRNWTGQDGTGQGRAGKATGHRPGTGIVTTRHRPTPTLPRRNTVSQSPIYRRPAVSRSCVRRGEARRGLNLNLK